MALFIASIAFILTHTLLFFVIITSVSFIWLFILSKDEIKNMKPFGGWANRVTAIRFLALIILALVYKYLSQLQISIWLAILIPLDGLDGYLARKRNEQTKMGAYFDMETDVLFVCIASCILFVRGLSGFVILIAAFFRYIYVLVVYLIGLHHIEEKRTKIGPIAAVFVFIALTLSFVVSDNIRPIIIYSTVLLLVISFSYSFALLLTDFRQNKTTEKITYRHKKTPPMAGLKF
jgi:CDP-diacylglycerol--glycerol-3-phosphate 3-phosphatidyltransferase